MTFRLQSEYTNQPCSRGNKFATIYTHKKKITQGFILTCPRLELGTPRFLLHYRSLVRSLGAFKAQSNYASRPQTLTLLPNLYPLGAPSPTISMSDCL